jgi:hypothetical protein
MTLSADLNPQDYCVLGLATCFLKTEEGLQEVQIIEPIPSAALEAIVKGIPTSYQRAWATTLAEIGSPDSLQIPPNFPPESQFCADFSERMIAATRTYKSNPQAQNLVPLGTSREDFNFSLEKKRVLNAVNVVRTEDNIKQHPHSHQG